MDDQTKIQVLMIYYEHWGKYEIRARKAAKGSKLTMDIFNKEYLYSESASLSDSIHILLDRYSGLHMTDLYKDLVSDLLKDCGGFYDDDWHLDDTRYSNEDLLFDKKYRFESNSGALSGECSEILYDDQFTEEHIASVEAIVALKPIHYCDDEDYDFLSEWDEEEEEEEL